MYFSLGLTHSYMVSIDFSMLALGHLVHELSFGQLFVLGSQGALA